jgi:beta-glucosidase
MDICTYDGYFERCPLGRIAKVWKDTYLSGVLAVAMVNGFQGTDLSNPSSIAACAKLL